MMKDGEEVTNTYVDYIESLKRYMYSNGLSAAVYTQTTDVEGELNGLLTYDRKIVKMDADRVREANQSLIALSSAKNVLKEKLDDAKATQKGVKTGDGPGEYSKEAIEFLKDSIKAAKMVYNNPHSTSDEQFAAVDTLTKQLREFKEMVNPPIEAGAQVDQFDSSTLSKAWSIFQEDTSKWSVTENPGHLVITGQKGDSHEKSNDIKNVFLQDAPSGDFEITTKLNASVQNNYEQGGLYIWQDVDNYVRLGHVWDNGLKLEAAKEENAKYSKAQNIAQHPGDDTVYLKINKTGNVISTFFWENGEWQKAADPITTDIKVSKVGIYGTSTVSNKLVPMTFDYFTLQSLQ